MGLCRRGRSKAGQRVLEFTNARRSEWTHAPASMNLIRVLSAVLLIASLGYGSNGIELQQTGCPLTFISPVAGSAWELKNVSSKTIVSYTFACLRKQHHKTELLFVDDAHADRSISGQISVAGGFDASPPNVCRHAGGRLFIYEVRFEDGTGWRSRFRK